MIGHPVGGHAPEAALQLLPEELPQAPGPRHRHGRLQQPTALGVLQPAHQGAGTANQERTAMSLPLLPTNQELGSGSLPHSPPPPQQWKAAPGQFGQSVVSICSRVANQWPALVAGWLISTRGLGAAANQEQASRSRQPMGGQAGGWLANQQLPLESKYQ